MKKPSCHRSGFLLPVAIAILVIVLFLTASRLYLSRHNLNVAARESQRERAYQIGASAVDVTITRLEEFFHWINTRNLSQTTTSPLSPELEVFSRALLGRDGLLTDTGAEVTIESPYFNFIKGVTEASSLEVTVTLSPAEPIYRTDSSVILTDPKEASFLLSIQAKAKCDKSTTTVRAFRRLKNVNILPPVIGKFVFYLRNQDGLSLNPVKDSNSPSALQEVPLVIHSGKQASLHSIPLSDVSSFLDDQGWIFLGTKGNWILGSTTGGKLPQYEEQTDDKVYVWDVESGSTLDRGGTISYYGQMETLYKELGTMTEEEVFFEKGAFDYSQTSFINLSGSSSSLSPTFILGNVYRKWAFIQGLKNNLRDTLAPLPFLDEETFLSANWPGSTSQGVISLIKEQFEYSYEKYSQRMSNLIVTPYNNTNLSFVNYDNQALENTLIKNDAVLLSENISLPPSSKLQTKGENISPAGVLDHSSVTLCDDEGRTIVKDLNLDLFEDLSYLREKSISFASFDAFATYQKQVPENGMLENTSKTLHFSRPGIFFIDSEMTLTSKVIIPRGMGGMVIAKGDVIVNESISAEDSEPFTLVSLTGNIHLNCSNTLQCAFIALSGTIHVPTSLSMHGLIAARNIELKRLAPPSTREITYNPAFDPTVSENYKQAYRITGESRWNRFVQ